MQPSSPRLESFFDHRPWPSETDEPHHVLMIMAGVFYMAGFLWACCALATCSNPIWIPARVRGDACLTPLFFVWPAFFWPLVFVMLPLIAIYLFMNCAVWFVWNVIRHATKCCGIPLPRWWLRIVGDGPAAASSRADLEMGSIMPNTENDGESEPDGGKDHSDPVGVRSAGSGESERPPSYTSLQLARDEDEDDSGETDGLLDNSTDGRMKGKLS